MNMLSTSIDNGKPTIGVFLDLSKAFDTLDHNILVSKLECYGIRGLCLDWIKSYLTNRKQFVQFNDSVSTEQIITCGVPQGSILGPLFFILYINDFPKIFELANSMLFADDTSIFLSHKNPDQLVDLLNKELKLVDLWMKTNKLSVNIKKTNFVLFKPRQKHIFLSSPILYSNCPLEQKLSTKFLGVFIDDHFTWKHHINYICNKISKSVGLLYKSRFFLTQKSKISLYYSLVYPYIQYCNIIWSSTYPSSLNRILLLQKRIIRIVANADYLSHTKPLFKNLKILDIFNLKLSVLYVLCFNIIMVCFLLLS